MLIPDESAMACGRRLPGRTVVVALLIVLALLAHAARAQDTPAGIATRTYGDKEAGTILGRSVLDSQGTDVGVLSDILVNNDGKPVAGIVDLGGFLGVGMHRVAIAWPLLRFVHDSGETIIHMDLTLDAAAASPESRGPATNTIVIERAPK